MDMELQIQAREGNKTKTINALTILSSTYYFTNQIIKYASLFTMLKANTDYVNN